MREQIRWRRVLLEGAVIVGSILLAFGIDAAWEARDEASRRSAVIEGLNSDFEAARTDLDRVTGFHLNSRSAAEDLMKMGAGGPVPATAAALADSLFAAAMLGGSFDPPLGTLQSLISSGDLDLVDDAELTILLTGFPAMVADLDREQQMVREVMLEVHRYLVSADIGSETALIDPLWEVPWDVGSKGIHRVAHSPGFRSWIGLLWIIYGNTTGDHQELDARLALIEARLSRLQ